MKIQPPKSIQLIFHRGAKKQEQPSGKIIDDYPKLLTWKENDRAVATFKTCPEIETNKSDLTAAIKKGLKRQNKNNEPLTSACCCTGQHNAASTFYSLISSSFGWPNAAKR